MSSKSAAASALRQVGKRTIPTVGEDHEVIDCGSAPLPATNRARPEERARAERVSDIGEEVAEAGVFAVGLGREIVRIGRPGARYNGDHGVEPPQATIRQRP